MTQIGIDPFILKFGCFQVLGSNYLHVSIYLYYLSLVFFFFLIPNLFRRLMSIQLASRHSSGYDKSCLAFSHETINTYIHSKNSSVACRSK